MGEERRLSVRQREREAQRQARRTRRRARRNLLRWIALAVIAAVALALVIGLMLGNLLPTGGQRKALTLEEKAQGPGEHLVGFTEADYWLPTSRDYHLNEPTPYTSYASTPPTHGPHWALPARWGTYEEPLPNERQVHNLEHGGMTIQYKPGNEELRTKVEDLAKSLRAFPSCIIVAPYPTMEHAIALTAWGVLLTLDEFDRDAIVDFVNFYRDQGPERTACADIMGP